VNRHHHAVHDLVAGYTECFAKNFDKHGRLLKWKLLHERGLSCLSRHTSNDSLRDRQHSGRVLLFQIGKASKPLHRASMSYFIPMTNAL
jgi:hypothetical protein